MALIAKPRAVPRSRLPSVFLVPHAGYGDVKRSSVPVNPTGVFRLAVLEGIMRLTHLVDFGKAVGKLQTSEGVLTK